MDRFFWWFDLASDSNKGFGVDAPTEFDHLPRDAMLASFCNDDLNSVFLFPQDEKGEFGGLDAGIVDSGLNSHLFTFTASFQILEAWAEFLC